MTLELLHCIRSTCLLFPTVYRPLRRSRPHRPDGRLGPLSAAGGRGPAAARVGGLLPGRRRSADPKLAEICQDFQWSGLGRFGAAIRYFKRHGVSDVIMAGKIHKTVLFKPWIIVRNTPDLRTIRMFIPHFLTHSKDNKDDTLLGAIVQEFAREGMRFGRPTDYAAELLVSKGH